MRAESESIGSEGVCSIVRGSVRVASRQSSFGVEMEVLGPLGGGRRPQAICTTVTISTLDRY